MYMISIKLLAIGISCWSFFNVNAQNTVTTDSPSVIAYSNKSVVLKWYMKPSNGWEVKILELYLNKLDKKTLLYSGLPSNYKPHKDIKLGDRLTATYKDNIHILKLTNLQCDDTNTFKLKTQFQKGNIIDVHVKNITINKVVGRPTYCKDQQQLKPATYVDDINKSTAVNITLCSCTKPIIKWTFGRTDLNQKIRISTKSQNSYDSVVTLPALTQEQCGLPLIFEANSGTMGKMQVFRGSTTVDFKFSPKKVTNLQLYRRRADKCLVVEWERPYTGLCLIDEYTVHILKNDTRLGTEQVTLNQRKVKSVFCQKEYFQVTHVKVQAKYKGEVGESTDATLLSEDPNPIKKSSSKSNAGVIGGIISITIVIIALVLILLYKQKEVKEFIEERKKANEKKKVANSESNAEDGVANYKDDLNHYAETLPLPPHSTNHKITNQYAAVPGAEPTSEKQPTPVYAQVEKNGKK